MKLSFAVLILLLFLPLGWLSSPAAGRPTAGDPLPLADYWKLAGDTAAQIAALQGADANETARQLGEIAARWKAIHSLALPDGAIVTVDHAELIAALGGPKPDLKALQGRFETLAAAGDGWPDSRFSTDDFAALDQILAQPEFQWKEAQPSGLQLWWQNLVDRFNRWLSRWLEGSNLGAAAPLFRWLLPGLGIMVVAVALAYLFYTIRRSIALEAALDLNHGDGEAEISAGAAFQKALDLSQAGDQRTAVRYLFLSALLLLEERGILHYDRTRTNRETLRSLSGVPELAAQLGEMVEVFDRVWYGYQPLDEPAFNEYVHRVESIKEMR